MTAAGSSGTYWPRQGLDPAARYATSASGPAPTRMGGLPGRGSRARGGRFGFAGYRPGSLPYAAPVTWGAEKVQISLNLGVLTLSGTWKPSDEERRAAWELYVELA